MKKILNILVSILIFLLINLHSPAKCEEYSFAAITYYNQGISQYHARSYRAAISSFKAAIQIEPGFVDAYYNLAEIYQYLNDSPNAIATYAKLIKIKPDDYDAVLEIAKAYYKQGSYNITLKYLSDIPSSYDRYSEVLKLKQATNSTLKPKQEKIATTNISNTTATPKKNIPNKIDLIQKFGSPTGITADSKGNLYIADYTANCVFKIFPDKKKILFSNNKLIKGPIGLATDKLDNIYVANYETNNILKISQNGNTTILLDKLKKPYCLYIKNDILYISEQGLNTLVKYNLK